jgi:hypothetical protein
MMWGMANNELPTHKMQDASRRNGAMSHGPATPAGRETSSMNALKHGLTTKAVLLPTENAAGYQEMADSWFTSLNPSSPAEATAVSELADLSFRLDRLRRLEGERLQLAVEESLQATPSYLTWKAALNVKTGLNGAVGALENKPCPTSVTPAVEGLAHGLRTLSDLVQRLGLPLADTHEYEDATRDLITDGSLSETAFNNLLPSLNTVLGAVDRKLPELEAAVEAERVKLADQVMMDEDKRLRKLERYRGYLQQAMARQLEITKAIRELASTSAPSGSFCGAISVEVRVVGRR